MKEILLLIIGQWIWLIYGFLLMMVERGERIQNIGKISRR